MTASGSLIPAQQIPFSVSGISFPGNNLLNPPENDKSGKNKQKG